MCVCIPRSVGQLHAAKVSGRRGTAEKLETGLAWLRLRLSALSALAQVLRPPASALGQRVGYETSFSMTIQPPGWNSTTYLSVCAADCAAWSTWPETPSSISLTTFRAVLTTAWPVASRLTSSTERAAMPGKRVGGTSSRGTQRAISLRRLDYRESRCLHTVRSSITTACGTHLRCVALLLLVPRQLLVNSRSK